MPVRAALELLAHRQQRILREWRAGKLQADGQIARESAGQRERRHARQITRRNQSRKAGILRPGAIRTMVQGLVDFRRGTQAGRREQHIHVAEELSLIHISSFDQRQILNVGYIYDLPIFTNKGLAHTLLGGWEISGITTFQTGTPFSVTDGLYNAGVGNGIGTCLLYTSRCV